MPQPPASACRTQVTAEAVGIALIFSPTTPDLHDPGRSAVGCCIQQTLVVSCGLLWLQPELKRKCPAANPQRHLALASHAVLVRPLSMR